jgi:hypothetical protein
MMATNQHSSDSETGISSTRVEERNIISAPAKTIQVERVRVSDLQRSSVASAFRAGRASALANR